jgi:hypothetical protein
MRRVTGAALAELDRTFSALKQDFIGEPTQPCPARLSKPAHNVTRANDVMGLAPLRNFLTPNPSAMRRGLG